MQNNNTPECRLDYLEESNEVLRMQNRVLATAFKGLLRALPANMAQDITESILLAFDDELAAIEYENQANAELFHDITYAFFREKQ